MLTIPKQVKAHPETKEYWIDNRHRVLRVLWHDNVHHRDYCHGCGEYHGSVHWGISEDACPVTVETAERFGMDSYTCSYIAWIIHRGIKNELDTDMIVRQINRISLMYEHGTHWFIYLSDLIESCKCFL